MHARTTYSLTVQDPQPPIPHRVADLPGCLFLWWHGVSEESSFVLNGSPDDLLAWLDQARQVVLDAQQEQAATQSAA